MLSRLSKRQSIRISAACVLVFLIAIVLRTAFVVEMIDQFQRFPPDTQKSFRFGYLTPDSRSYLEPAVRIAEGDLLNAGSLTRPPGYPLFIWVCGRVASRVLTAQAVIGALIPVGTLLLSFLIARNLPVSFVAALMSAVSPTGVGVTGLVLADLLLAPLFLLGLLMLLHGASRNHIAWPVLAALVFGWAGLVKPVLLLWPLASVAVWWLFRKAAGKPVAWVHALILIAVPNCIFAGWASCNYARDGVFALSEKGPQTVRVYLAAAVDAWGTSQHPPSGQEISRYQAEVRQRLSQLSPKERMQTYREESLGILCTHPAIAVVVFWMNMKAPAIQGWDHFHVQIPLKPSLLSGHQRATEVESKIRKVIRWPVMLTFVVGMLALRFFPSPRSRRLCFQVFGLSLAYYYFMVMSGVTFWTGPRIVYPAESVALAILAAGLALVLTVVRTARAQRAVTDPPDSSASNTKSG
jgi:hypothetical protein